MRSRLAPMLLAAVLTGPALLVGACTADGSFEIPVEGSGPAADPDATSDPGPIPDASGPTDDADREVPPDADTDADLPLPPSDAAEDNTPAPDAGGSDDGSPSDDDTTDDAGQDPIDADEPAPVLVDVGHEREFRGVWVATVSNINFPSRTGLTAAQLRAEIDALVDLTRRSGLNAIVFQVRPEADALYASTLEPWSRYLTGTQGGNPGMDPLQTLIEAAHAQNIEVHAWLNPYRAKANHASTAVAPHLSVTSPSYAYRYGNAIWMDPGVEVVQQRLLDVIEDLVTRYELDGIHFDDYFYPYPDGPFPDTATYDAYRAAGGTLSVGDWRRDNVNRMVRAVHELILGLDDTVRFGISPFGIYRPGIPPGITGLDQYATIFADPVRWMEEGWLDYVAPQLYWPTTQTAQAYETLLAWWVTVHPRVYVFAGTYLSRLGDTTAWTVDEFREQVRLSRAYRSGNSMGNIHFQIGPLQQNRTGIRDTFANELYAAPALTPPLVSASERRVAVPRVTPTGAAATWSLRHEDAAPLRAWTLYGETADGWELVRVIPPDATEVTTGPGRWAIAAVTRHGVESPGVLLAEAAE